MIRVIMFFLSTLWMTGFAYAEMNMKLLVVEGVGDSQSEAIQNGLIEALNQTQGITIESKKNFIKEIKEKDVSCNGKTTHAVSVNEQMQSSIREATQGTIDGYRIVDSQTLENGKSRITLEIKLWEYETPGISPESRRKIAIIPFRTPKNYYEFDGQRIPSAELSMRFTQNLVTELTQSRRFTVLDREYTEEFLREKNLILSPDSPVAEQAKIGQVLGVDYLLIGTITEAMHECTPYRIVISGETGYNCRASLAADYRILVMATRQIKWADTIGFSLGDAQPKKTGKSPAEIQNALFSGAAKKIVVKALDNIYPLRVVQVQSNGDLVINQGGTTLAVGDMLEVFNAGGKIIDPYTGESLGASESWAATAKIIRVTPKMAYATVVKGSAANIQVGGICRRSENEPASQSSKSTSPKKTTVQTLPGGGVVLPFD